LLLKTSAKFINVNMARHTSTGCGASEKGRLLDL